MSERRGPLVIGVTGGVGSGKSCILQILREKWNARILLADEIAHELMEPGQEGCRQVVEALGEGILAPDGTIDRRALAARIFSDDRARETVDAIIHPLVWREVRRRLKEAAGEGVSLAVVEAALPSEKVHDIYDEMWYVYTSRENRIRRLMEGRGYTREKCESIMASQLSDGEFRRLCDVEIDNNGDLEDAERQVRERMESRGLTR